MKLRKTLQSSDESPLTMSTQPSTLRKQRPTQDDTVQSASQSIPFSPPTSPSSSRMSPKRTSHVYSPSPAVQSDDNDEQASLSSSPKAASTLLTFRGWPIVRKMPSASTSPPMPSQSPPSAWWASSSRPPTNGHPNCPDSGPSSFSSSPASSPSNPSSPASVPLSRNSSTDSSAASPTSTSSAYSVTVTAPAVSSFQHPFIPQRPYSAPLCQPTCSDPFSPTEQSRRRATTGTQMQDIIKEGIAAEPPCLVNSPPSGLPYVGFPDHDDRKSVASDHSIVQSVTVFNNAADFSLHIRLPGFKHSNLVISSRRDRSLSITADKFDDEVQQLRTGLPSSTSSSTPPERLAGHFERSVQFGPDADPSRASAHFDGETLIVTVPKRRTWVDLIKRDQQSTSNDDGASLGVPPVNEEKSPRSVALALGARVSTSNASSPGSESTTPGSEMSGTSSDDTSMPSPVSEDIYDEEDDAGRQKRDMDMDQHSGQDLVMTADDSSTSTGMTPVLLTMQINSPALSPPLSHPLHTASHSTSTRGIHQHSHSRNSSSSSSLEAAKRQLGYEDDLVTPTPARIRRSGEVPLPNAAAATSPKKDYFGFPLVGPPPASTKTKEKHRRDSDELEEMRISPPPQRTREQGMGRSAFFWKKWTGAGSTSTNVTGNS